MKTLAKAPSLSEGSTVKEIIPFAKQIMIAQYYYSMALARTSLFAKSTAFTRTAAMFTKGH